MLDKIDLTPVAYLLWDIDLELFSLEVYQEFLAVRIAEKGNIRSLNWYFINVGKDKFLHAVLTSSQITAQTRNFWRLYLKSVD